MSLNSLGWNALQAKLLDAQEALFFSTPELMQGILQNLTGWWWRVLGLETYGRFAARAVYNAIQGSDANVLFDYDFG